MISKSFNFIFYRKQYLWELIKSLKLKQVTGDYLVAMEIHEQETHALYTAHLTVDLPCVTHVLIIEFLIKAGDEK